MNILSMKSIVSEHINNDWNWQTLRREKNNHIEPRAIHITNPLLLLFFVVSSSSNFRMDCLKGYSLEITRVSLGKLIVSSKIHYLETLNTQQTNTLTHTHRQLLAPKCCWQMIKICGKKQELAYSSYPMRMTTREGDLRWRVRRIHLDSLL